MAEAHGQLTGRPAACLGDPRGRCRQPRHRHPHGTADSTPMFALVGQVAARVPGPRGVPGDRPGRRRSGGSPTWPSRSTIAERVAPAMAEATRQALGGRPGPVVIAVPEDLLDEQMPAGADGRSHVTRFRPADPEPDDVRAVLQPPDGRRASGHPGRGRRPPARARRPTSSASPRSSTCRSIASWRRRRRLPERPSALPRDDRLRRRRRRSANGWRRPTRCSSSAPGSTRSPRSAIACPDPASAGPTSTSSRASAGPGSPAPTVAVAVDARTFLRVAEPAPAAGPSSTRIGSMPAGRPTRRIGRPGRPRRSSTASRGHGPGVHPGPDRGHARVGSCRPTRS